MTPARCIMGLNAHEERSPRVQWLGRRSGDDIRDRCDARVRASRLDGGLDRGIPDTGITSAVVRNRRSSCRPRFAPCAHFAAEQLGATSSPAAHAAIDGLLAGTIPSAAPIGATISDMESQVKDKLGGLFK